MTSYRPLFSKYLAILALALLGLFFDASYALQLSGAEPLVNPTQSASFLVDPSGRLTLDEIKSSNFQQKFKLIKSTDDQINFGFSESAYWFKLSLSRSADAPDSWILEIPYLGLDQIDFYAPGRLVIETGNFRPVESRPLFNRSYAFPLILKEAPQDYYIRVSSQSPISLPLDLWQSDAFSRHAQYDTLLQALYYGGVGALAIFNFLIFLYLRDKTYLLYSLFATFIGLGNFSGNGYGHLYLWPSNPAWNQISQAVFLGMAATIAWLFTREFLNTKKFLPRTDRVLLLVSALLAFSTGGLIASYCFSFSPSIFLQLIPLLSLPGAALTIYAAMQVWAMGQQSAKYFLFAWGVLSLGTIIAALRMFDMVPSNVYTSYALQISSAIEMLLLSFALANRIQIERQLRERAQLDALDSKQTMVDSLKASEERLERTVAIRTNEIEQMLENEKRLREQYVRFGSMISHEFRNPLGIIETQLALLARGGEGKLEKRVSIIGSATHRLAMLFDRWLQGDRLENKIDTALPQIIQLNSWLEELIEKCRIYHSTHQLQFIEYEKEVVLKADEKMLQVVVLNLIDNACKYSPVDSVVSIGIRLLPGKIGISVADQGAGIHPEDHIEIFEEFVQIDPTPHSRGVGLGLAFVKRIVDLHSGSIELISAPGKGSEFIVWFPEESTDFVHAEL